MVKSSALGKCLATSPQGRSADGRAGHWSVPIVGSLPPSAVILFGLQAELSDRGQPSPEGGRNARTPAPEGAPRESCPAPCTCSISVPGGQHTLGTRKANIHHAELRQLVKASRVEAYKTAWGTCMLERLGGIWHFREEPRQVGNTRDLVDKDCGSLRGWFQPSPAAHSERP